MFEGDQEVDEPIIFFDFGGLVFSGWLQYMFAFKKGKVSSFDSIIMNVPHHMLPELNFVRKK